MGDDRSRLEPIKKVARMFKNHHEGPLSYFDPRGINATIEGFNSRIQSIKLSARGFRKFENEPVRILFYCGKLELMPGPTHSIPRRTDKICPTRKSRVYPREIRWRPKRQADDKNSACRPMISHMNHLRVIKRLSRPRDCPFHHFSLPDMPIFNVRVAQFGIQSENLREELER